MKTIAQVINISQDGHSAKRRTRGTISRKQIFTNKIISLIGAEIN